MVSSDIREFNFTDKQKYVWTPGDFTNLQLWLQELIKGLGEAGFGGSILSGLKVTPGGGLALSCPTGVAISQGGKIMVKTGSPTSHTFSSPVGNPAWSLLVMRPTTVDMTYIPVPTNPSLTTPLHKQWSFEIAVINGTPAGSPAYPFGSMGSDDIILMGVKLTAGHTTITASDFDYSIVDVPKKLRSVMTSFSASASVALTDEYIEADATSGDLTLTLPAAALCPGERFNIVKIDTSANKVIVDASGSETISGQLTQELDDQWQMLEIISNGINWRVL